MKKANGGYTLVELLVTLALTGLVFAIAGSSIYQLNTVTGYGNDRLTTRHELQNAYLWFSRDGKEALTAGGDSHNLTFTLSDNSVIDYRLSGDTLVRVSSASSVTLVRNVTDLRFSIEDRLVSMEISTAVSGRLEESVQSNYQVCLQLVP